MKLLICTQVVDRNHPVLGFVHLWIEEFAKHFESVSVICLQEGIHALPSNVQVFTLGKEKGAVSGLTYAVRFWKILRKLRNSYDAVYVHMNPEYVFLGASEWRKTNKKTALWYNHDFGGWKLNVAAGMVDVLMHTSAYAASAGRKNSRLMPTGINTAIFKQQQVEARPNSIYFQGRIAPSKRLHVLLAAVQELASRIPDVRIDIAGPGRETLYAQQLQSDFSTLFSSGVATFLGPIPNPDTPVVFAAHVVSVNLTAAGNFDKSVMESIACGTPAVVSSPAFAGIVPTEFFFAENDHISLANTLERVLGYSPTQRAESIESAREIIQSAHSLKRLGEEAFATFST